MSVKVLACVGLEVLLLHSLSSGDLCQTFSVKIFHLKPEINFDNILRKTMVNILSVIFVYSLEKYSHAKDH